MELLGKFGRCGLVGGSVSLEVGFESLRAHATLSSCSLLVLAVQDVSFQLLLQLLCLLLAAVSSYYVLIKAMLTNDVRLIVLNS